MIRVAYYNEIDKFAAEWLRQLIKAGVIAPGEVDERSIADVKPSDIAGFQQHHFFAGIGVWSWALRQSKWEDDRQVWTGSCPCPPFSTAGKKKQCPKCGGKPVCHAFKSGVFECINCGHGWYADGRHLWPDFYRLIKECRPDTVFGEQVAAKDGEAWLDIVSATLELESYAVGSAVTAACGFGAPHMRKRIYWVAESEKCSREGKQAKIPAGWRQCAESGNRGKACRVENNRSDRRRTGRDDNTKDDRGESNTAESVSGLYPVNGFWRDADWLFCRDGKFRAVEPGTFPLANGVANRVGRLRGYGNAIVAQQAQAFIESYMEVVAV